MNEKKLSAIVALLSFILVSLIACAVSLVVSTFIPKGQSVQWEYKIEQFSREDYYDFRSTLEDLGEDGWEYAGPICNNGINAQYIAFMRPL